MKENKTAVKAFKEYLNSLPSPNYRNGRFHQQTRKYGDYLYAQDREKFNADMAEWLKGLRTVTTEPLTHPMKGNMTETKHTPLPWTIHPLSKRKVLPCLHRAAVWNDSSGHESETCDT